MEARTFYFMQQFWRENEIRVFSARETQLYFFLLAEYNRQHHQNPFGCSTQRITNNLSISRQTLCRLREKLKDRELLVYEEGKNFSSVPCYTLLTKQCSRTVQMNGTLDGTTEVTPDGTIRKECNIVNSITSKDELLPLDKLQDLLHKDREWLENVREYAGKQRIEYDVPDLYELLTEFFLYLQTCGTVSKTVSDAQRHFVNWLIKRGNNRTNRPKSLRVQQVGVKLTDNSPDKFKNISEW